MATPLTRQIVLEELHYPSARVEYVQGDTLTTPDQGTTAGSKSLQNGGPELRAAAATAFQALLDLAATNLGAPKGRLTVKDGVVTDTATRRRVTYERLLADAESTLAADATAPLVAPADYDVVGTSVPRAELPGKLTARFDYVQDVTVPDMLHDTTRATSRPSRCTGRWARPARSPTSATSRTRKPVWWRPCGRRRRASTGSEPRSPSFSVCRTRSRYASSTRRAPGCYGHNGADGADDAAADAALMSKAVRRPVRVQWSRQDEHSWEPLGPAMAHDLRGGITAGRVVAWEHLLYTPTHNTRPNGTAGTVVAGQLTGSLPAPLPPDARDAGGRNAPVTYAFPNNRLLTHLVRTFETTAPDSPTPAAPLRYRFMRSTALRPLGGVSNTFANESFLDELAHTAGEDPLALRLRSLDDPRAADVVRALSNAWAGRPSGGSGTGTVTGAGIAFARYETQYTYAAVYAEVGVDTATGAVRVQRVVVAHDCGLVVNPDRLRNQIEGNVIQGISRALHEEVRYDASGVTSVVWQQSQFNPTPQYTILRFSEVPRIETILIDRPEEPAWGAGEPPSFRRPQPSATRWSPPPEPVCVRCR